jgi:hypothetical protein
VEADDADRPAADDFVEGVGSEARTVGEFGAALADGGRGQVEVDEGGDTAATGVCRSGGVHVGVEGVGTDRLEGEGLAVGYAAFCGWEVVGTLSEGGVDSGTGHACHAAIDGPPALIKGRLHRQVGPVVVVALGVAVDPLVPGDMALHLGQVMAAKTVQQVSLGARSSDLGDGGGPFDTDGAAGQPRGDLGQVGEAPGQTHVEAGGVMGDIETPRRPVGDVAAPIRQRHLATVGLGQDGDLVGHGVGLDRLPIT